MSTQNSNNELQLQERADVALKPNRTSALLKLFFRVRRTSSPSILPVTDGLEVRRTTQLDPNFKLYQRTGFNFWRWFWISTLVVSLPYAWYCFYVPANRIAWAADFSSAQQQASQTSKPIILFFTGKWCVPCRIMKRTVWADEQISASVNASFIPVIIDVDDPESTITRSRYNVGFTPITIITDSQGNVLQHKVGGVGKADFLEMLRYSSGVLKTTSGN